MISLDRLQQIIPADQALAMKALATSLQQITGISNLSLPEFALAVNAMQTTKDLPLITALTEAVPPAVANYYINTLGNPASDNNDIRIVDVLGLAAGWIATDAFARTVEIFGTMNLSTLTTIYQTMTNALNGNYGPLDSGPLIIPSGLPCAGTYNGTFFSVPNPEPPPASFDGYDPTAISLAMACLTRAASAEINNLVATYPEQTTELNTLFADMAQQVVLENSLQAEINLNYSDLVANDRNAIYSFILSLSTYGLATEQGGIAWFLENTAELGTLSGEAIVAALRQGRNQQALNTVGIYSNNAIPLEPDPPPPEADLLPAEYTENEAIDLIPK